LVLDGAEGFGFQVFIGGAANEPHEFVFHANRTPSRDGLPQHALLAEQVRRSFRHDLNAFVQNRTPVAHSISEIINRVHFYNSALGIVKKNTGPFCPWKRLPRVEQDSERSPQKGLDRERLVFSITSSADESVCFGLAS
jgi:hypothetical protein